MFSNQSVPVSVQSNNRAQYSQTSDDDVFEHLAKTFSYAHAYMHKGPKCSQGYREPDGGFQDGITNGAAWYPVTGEELRILGTS